MTPPEIRTRQDAIAKDMDRRESVDGRSDIQRQEEMMLGVCYWLAEIAGQLAEANQQPRWVWFKMGTLKYVVDAREVASVSSPKPDQCVIIMRNEGGEDPGRWCEGSYAEVCAKLGIPVEEPWT